MTTIVELFLFGKLKYTESFCLVHIMGFYQSFKVDIVLKPLLDFFEKFNGIIVYKKVLRFKGH